MLIGAQQLQDSAGVVQHRRGRRYEGLGAARGSPTGGGEEVGSGAHYKCPQRGAYSLVVGGLMRVGSVYVECIT